MKAPSKKIRIANATEVEFFAVGTWNGGVFVWLSEQFEKDSIMSSFEVSKQAREL